MGQVRHGSATTTHAVRAAIQRSQASLSTLSRELGINPKTVAKWRKRATVEDLKTGPKSPHSTTLTEAEEAAVIAFRRHTLLPLDDCLSALQPSIPHLTRTALHRCLQRCSAVPSAGHLGDKALLNEVEGPKRQRFKRYPIGFFTWISPRFRLPKASSTCSSASTARVNSQSPSLSTRLTGERRGSSLSTC
jgi:transposase-like protein